MKITHKTLFFFATIGLAFSSFALAEPSNPPKPIKAAIFVQNLAGDALQEKLPMLNDLISARLTEHGFTILDRKEILERWQEGLKDTQNRSVEAEQVAKAVSSEINNSLVIEAPFENSLNNTSALRLAQFLLKHPQRQVTIQVTHDLDCEIVKKGKVYGAKLVGKQGISLDCGDDVS